MNLGSWIHTRKYDQTVTDFDSKLPQTMDKLTYKFASSRHVPSDLRIGDNSGETDLDMQEQAVTLPGQDECLLPVSTTTTEGV